MIKGYYIDSALQIVNGGNVTDENEVWREDIEALLPAAVNFVVLGSLWEQFANEKDKDINNGFIKPFIDQPLTKVNDDMYSFTIPVPIIELPSDRGLRMVTSQDGGHFYQKMNDNLYANWNYYKRIMVNQRYYRLIGTTGFVYNKPTLETKINLYTLATADAYGDNDVLPVPAGKELIVIQQLAALFSRQQQLGERQTLTKSDLNK